jgi:hypothetical protein
MKKQIFYRTLLVSDPTVGIYESINLIKEKDVVIFVRNATEKDKKTFGKYTETIYKNIHTNIEIGISWSGPDSLFVEEVEVIMND